MEDAADRNIEQWKIKRLIKSLENARGNGTSMISLIIPPRDQISRVNNMLTTEYGTASNIKSRVNRTSVLTAITSAQQRLKLYSKTPPNGLVIYCGIVLTDDNKEKKVNIDFEPFKPINTTLYLCDNKFHTEPLRELLECDDRFGFIVMDGNGALYGTVQGNSREVLHRFMVDLPKKHGRGGQSALRFARLRTEKRHNYLRKAAEVATQMFITNDKINVSGLVLAGSADFKNDLYNTDMFDPRLHSKVLKVVDISYGGDNGFNQAIELAQDTLANVKFVQEKKIVTKFFEEVAQDTGKYVFGIKETIEALEAGGCELVIAHEDLKTIRVHMQHPTTDRDVVVFIKPEQENDEKVYKCPDTGVELKIVDKSFITEWLANNYKRFGAQVEFITDKSQEGSQFVRGFGGLGGLLRYKMNFLDYDGEIAENDDDFI